MAKKDGKNDDANDESKPVVETTDSSQGGSGDGAGQGAGGTDSDEGKTVRQIIQEELAKLTGTPDKPEPESRPAGERLSLGDQERMAEELVRKAAAKLAKEHEHDKDHETVKEVLKKGKEVAEEAPAKVRRLTKALWGSDK